MVDGFTREVISARTPAVVAIVALVAIGLDAAFAINGVLSANAPHVVFSLGTTDRDVTYCNSQMLDLYIPTRAARHPLPLAVFVHGGGMVSGDKTNLKPVFLNALASAGYAVASVNYRLAPMAKFPAQLEDVKCAIRYLRDKASTYGLDPSEIFAFGTSVGGQFVALSALTGPHSAFDVGPYLNQSSSVRAVVDMFGPANLSERAGFTPTGVLRDFGASSGPSDLVRASPTHYVVPNAPPIMLVHGIQDAKVPESQSIELYNDLVAAGDSAQFIPVRTWGTCSCRLARSHLFRVLSRSGKTSSISSIDSWQAVEMSSNASVGVKASAWNLVVAGYALATVGLLADLPTIGASGTPAVVSIGVGVPIGIGILLASAGMLQLRRAVDRDREGARRGLAMQGLGLIALLVGVLALQISSSIADRDQQSSVVVGVLFVSVVFVLSSGGLMIAGGLLLINHHSDVGARNGIDVGYMLLGTALILVGVGGILGAKLGYFFVLPDVASTVVEDAGAAVTACGCVVAAYSSFMIPARLSVDASRLEVHQPAIFRTGASQS